MTITFRCHGSGPSRSRRSGRSQPSPNIKRPDQRELIPRAAEAIACLNASGFFVVICTNRQVVGRSLMSDAQLEEVHDGLRRMLRDRGAVIEKIICAENAHKAPGPKPSGAMLGQALRRYEANPAQKPCVGDQLGDLEAPSTQAAGACWCEPAWPAIRYRGLGRSV